MKQKITCTINNEKKTIYVRQATILLDMLRDELGLTGAKPGCKNGDCGTCTILKGNRPMKSCLMLAVEADGENFTTIEGIKDTPIQKAFLEKFAFQCGYCTSGFIMNCHALSICQPNATAYDIKNWLQSNICRCTGYEEIKEAMLEVLQNKHSNNHKT
ncbi:(2Fe-2S)-binding protein [Pseudogracilibacillus sp. ICA-222130]|uniref:(2Fe-2S)-binding protein n=1 Tax=Pseudogracilibacillus sp. ICA-222130 TaxID=3134655 RepID=UPI0030C60E6E